MTWARLAFRLLWSSIGFATFVYLGLSAVSWWLTAGGRVVGESAA